MCAMLFPILFFAIVPCWPVSGILSTCPQFGSYPSSSIQYSNRDGLFLSIDSPSQCYGQVTQWNYCYQRSGSPDKTHGVKFMVYRQNATTSVYYRVSNSLSSLQRTFSPRSNCISLFLNQTYQFSIQPNDIVAICMVNMGSIEPLRVLSDESNKARHITSISDHCTENDLISLNMDMLNSQIRDYLLVEAVINSSSGFRAGNSPRGSSSSTLPGIYVNQAFPADSTGYITSWNYCYYTSDDDSLYNYTAVFAIWRYSNESGSSILSMVNDSATVITLQPKYTIAAIFCKVLELDPEKHIPIVEGDYIGVILPPDNEIPLIGGASDHNILVNYDTQDATSLPMNSFRQEQLALHLYANIEHFQATSISTTEESGTQEISTRELFALTTTQPPSTEDSMVQTSGTSDRVVAAITIIIFIAVVLAVGVVLLIVLIFQRKLKTSEHTVTSNNVNIPQSFDNVNYTRFNAGIHDVQPYETLPGTAVSEETETQFNQYEPKTDQPIRPRAASMLEESNVYASVDTYVDNLYSSVDQSISENTYSEVEPESYMVPHVEEEHLYSQIYTESRADNIDKKSIRVLHYLGSGQSGSVNEGIWFKGNEQVKVAIKRLRDNASSKEKVRFLQEAVLMAQFKHKNVIQLLGMVLEDNPITLVIELASRGDLRKNLLEIRDKCSDPNLPKLLLYFSRQIAFGMNYLSSRHFVHRDLAARNILLSEDCICKIADFGLSRELEDENYYKSSGGLVPVKWTAPEAIEYRRYSTASDVWSYGCILYEIWSLGHKPFERNQNFEIADILNKGTRLPPPPGCPRAIYAIMIECWHPDASERPSFQDLVLSLTKNESIMVIPESVIASIPDYQVPGGDLSLGEHVYWDLQRTYI